MTRPQFFLSALFAGAWIVIIAEVTPYLAGLFLVLAP